jgi:beta-glucosidase
MERRPDDQDHESQQPAGGAAEARPSASGFPADFAWGTATAAYQIEGAPTEDGKGESIWDRFSRMPGAIVDGTTGDIACDSYHRWNEDIAAQTQLGADSYRFSLAWTRVLPQGFGKLNRPGLDFYDRAVDELLARRIAPYVTLYHWDLPQALQDRGGWEQRDTAHAFADYAQAAARRLGDRVRHWITLNEPHIVVYEGFVNGRMAPGLKDRALIGPVSHHLLLAHGQAVQALRAEAPGAAVGITLNVNYLEPASDRAEDEQATRELDGLWHRWYLDPLYHGAYPEDVGHLVAQPAGLVRAGDLETIAAPLDFLGSNYYTRVRVRAGEEADALPRLVPPAGPLTTMGWEVYPDGLYQTLSRIQRDYAPKLVYVTENGAAYPDTLSDDERVHDPERTRYLRLHLAQVKRAIADGMPVRGYFAWSLLDNFEWARGHTQRFGLFYTDYPTQRRILKDSGRFMAEVTATNGAALTEDEEI